MRLYGNYDLFFRNLNEVPFYFIIFFTFDLQLPEDIEWHFIGNLQSNKAKALLCMHLFFCFILILFGRSALFMSPNWQYHFK